MLTNYLYMFRPGPGSTQRIFLVNTKHIFSRKVTKMCELTSESFQCGIIEAGKCNAIAIACRSCADKAVRCQLKFVFTEM